MKRKPRRARAPKPANRRHTIATASTVERRSGVSSGKESGPRVDATAKETQTSHITIHDNSAEHPITGEQSLRDMRCSRCGPFRMP